VYIGETKTTENVSKKIEEASSKKASPTQNPSSSTSSSSSKPKDSGFEWSFKQSFSFGSGSGGSKPFEGSNKDKTFMIVSALSVAGVLTYIFSQDFNQKEITWREFTYK